MLWQLQLPSPIPGLAYDTPNPGDVQRLLSAASTFGGLALLFKPAGTYQLFAYTMVSSR